MKFKDKPYQHQLKVDHKPDRVYRVDQVLDLVNNHLTMSVAVPILNCFGRQNMKSFGSLDRRQH